MSDLASNQLAGQRSSVPSTSRTLRRLFLTVFLRGHTSRGLTKNKAPKSVLSKLALTLFAYFLFGCLAIYVLHQSVYVLSVFLHVMTFVFLGTFLASSAGEILFNKEEGDILLHLPVTSKQLLWAKVRVIVEVSLWVAAAFNLVGMCVGVFATDGNWLFPVVHAMSTGLEAMFCAGSVVLVYQLCLKHFGRERLESVMTTAQVLLSVGAVLGSQLLPRMLTQEGRLLSLGEASKWVIAFPPAWFAGFDDALAGSMAPASWGLGALAVIATGFVAWMAFDKLADNYQTGLQTLQETVSQSRKPAAKRWLETLAGMPPLRWWLRDPVARASFLLTAAYLTRDRDIKLRIYPSVAPMLMIPIVMLAPVGGRTEPGQFQTLSIAFAGCYLGLVPLTTMSILRFSQQWKAADLFRVVPIAGPARLCNGARMAVMLLIALPTVLIAAAISLAMNRDLANLLLLLPGVLLLPILGLIPSAVGGAIPLSTPIEEAKSARRGLPMMGAMIPSVALAFLANTAWLYGWFGALLAVEAAVVVCLYILLRQIQAGVRWPSID